MKIACDWDGTIVHRTGIPTNSNPWSDKPKKGAIETLRLLDDFYILTNRPKEDWPMMKKWLRENGYSKEVLITNVKQPNTTVYLDDRAIRFTSWNDFRKLYI
jgi:predicted phosphatase